LLTDNGCDVRIPETNSESFPSPVNPIAVSGCFARKDNHIPCKCKW